MPRYGTEMEVDRYATKGHEVFGGVIAVSEAPIDATFGDPISTGIGPIADYFAGKETIMSIEDDHDKNQWFKYKCPKCGCEWKEKIHTNDDPDDSSWIANTPY